MNLQHSANNMTPQSSTTEYGDDHRRRTYSSTGWTPSIITVKIPDSTSSERLWGPVTAVSCVLWLGLRTDALFPVWFEWGIFCIWMVSYIVYIDQQAKAVRPRREKTFVLIVFVVAIVFIGLIAVIFRQQARHVFTSLPLCLAFSTFGVSYGFGLFCNKLGLSPGRARGSEDGGLVELAPS
ncbi:hypothetical protein QBC37DRAFT_86447 [Rhypophila decipiens]|uniref:Uncharacterized protein n=1 Tax=Rhypophila decipiens TaxID=261697 RepID=A0AAN6XW99_9PEZI|nr:hypothetical protein QBC37DRAFT_86447 [Rhypophila decipiens]